MTSLDKPTPQRSRGRGSQTPLDPGDGRAHVLAEYRKLLRSVRERTDDPTRHLDLAQFLIRHRYLDRALSSLHVARALQPRRIETAYILGWLYSEQGNLEQAKITYREIIKIKPSEARAHLLLGQTLLSLDLKEEATQSLSRAVELDPDKPDAYWLLGEIATGRQDFEQALGYYHALKTLAPNSVELHFRIGSLQKRRGLSDRAVLALQKALSLDVHHAGSRQALAGLYLEGDLPSKALELLEDPQVAEHRDADSYLIQARAYSAIGESSRALSTLVQMSVEFPDDARSHRELAMAYHRTGEHELAEIEFERAIAVDPKNRSLFMELGALLVGLRRHHQAIELFAQAAARFPADAEIHGFHADILDQCGRTEEAVESLSRAIEAGEADVSPAGGDPGREVPHIKRARLRIKLGRYTEALEDFERVRQINPDCPDAKLDTELIRRHQKYQEAFDLHQRARDAWSQGDWIQARNLLKEALRLAPDNVGWLKEYLDQNLRTGQFNEATSVLTKLEILEPEGRETLLRHADILFNIHSYERGEELYRRAIEPGQPSLRARIGILRCTGRRLVSKSISPDAVKNLGLSFERGGPDDGSGAQTVEHAWFHTVVGSLVEPGGQWASRAIELFNRQVPGESHEVTVMRSLGLYETYARLGDLKQMSLVLEGLTRRFPLDLHYAVALVETAQATGDPARAYQLAEGFRGRFPENGWIRCLALKSLALLAEQSKNPRGLARKRIRDLKITAAQEASDAMAFFELGMGLHYLADPDGEPLARERAQIALNKAKSLAPRNVWPWWGLVMTSLHHAPARSSSAEVARQLTQVRSAIALFPTEACFHYYMGRVLLSSPDPEHEEAGIQSLVNATLFERPFCPAEHELGEHHHEVGDAARAYHHFLRVVESIHGARHLLSARERMNRLVT